MMVLIGRVGVVVAGLLAPVSNTVRGLKGYMAGLRWLKSNPKYLVLLFVPMLIGLVCMSVGWGLLFSYDDEIFAWILFDRPEAWYFLVFYWLCQVFLYIGMVAVGVLGFILISNVLAAPIYEIVSSAVERDWTGRPIEEIGLWESIKLMGEELKKVALILFVSVAIFLIPGLNLIGTLVAAFLIGWDFYDYPLARRGWTFGDRWRFVIADGWAVMGLGLWLMIPLVQIFLMPMAVVGGTLLNLEALERQGVVQRQS